MSALVDLRRRGTRTPWPSSGARHSFACLQSVLTHFTDGLSARESGDRLGLSRKSVQKYRNVLHLACWDAGVVAVTRTSGG